MSKREKLLIQFLQHPTSLKFSKIENILLDLGFKKTQAKGSHVKYEHIALKNIIIVPIHNNDCMNTYKRVIAKAIKKLFL